MPVAWKRRGGCGWLKAPVRSRPRSSFSLREGMGGREHYHLLVFGREMGSEIEERVAHWVGKRGKGAGIFGKIHTYEETVEIDAGINECLRSNKNPGVGCLIILAFGRRWKGKSKRALIARKEEEREKDAGFLDRFTHTEKTIAIGTGVNKCLRNSKNMCVSRVVTFFLVD